MTVEAPKSLAVHNVGFYKPEIRGINCMRFNDETSQLAVSRSDNSIEIWDCKHLPYLQIFIPCEINCSVEDVVWCGSRLLSCGFQGTIIEYELYNAAIKAPTTLTGGVAWCLAYYPKTKLLAVGTEDGFINVLEVNENGLEHLKLLDKQQGRVLCISWDSTGELLVTGSVDVVRVWSFKTGHVIHKMTTGRSHTQRETIVWSLQVTSDLTIISGDSRGFITFWDGKLGTQVDSFRSHEADILSVALASDESSVVCAGVDPVLAVYGRVSGCVGKRQWARGGLLRLHDHDVRAVATAPDGRVFSAGVSGFLVVMNTAPKLRIACPPFLKGNCVQVIPKLKQLLLRYLDHIELWLLGSAMADSGQSDTPLLLAENPKCLLKLGVKTNQVITAAAVSDKGDRIAVSTQKELNFYTFDLEELAVNKLGSAECGPASLLVFFPDGSGRCLVVTVDNLVCDLHVSEDSIEESSSFRPSTSSSVTGCITHMAISPCGKFVCLADAGSNVAVWSTSSWSVFATLPRYQAVPTAVAFATDSKTVILTYSDLNLVAYNLKQKRYSKMSKQLGNTGVFHNAISGIIVNPKRSDSVILHDDSAMCAIYKNSEFQPSAKIAKNERKDKKASPGQSETEKSSIVVRKFKHIVGAAALDGNEMVLVEATPLALTETLPPLFMKKKFGT